MQVRTVNFTARNFHLSLTNAFKETGFVVLNPHPISQKLIKENNEKWCDFFSTAHKYNFQYNKKSLDGYFPFGLEKGRKENYADLKEFYYFYPWGKCPDSLREITLALYHEFFDLGIKLLEGIQHALPDEIRNQLSMPLQKMVENTPRAVLRILHYPPLRESQEFNLAEKARLGAIRAVEHEDLTLISMIMSLVGSGLQLKDIAGQWHTAPTGTDHIVINIGDMLELCTRGFYKATTHRVINPTHEEICFSRYSNAFFMNPCDEVSLDEHHTALSCLTKHIRKKLDYAEQRS